jgi:hypothetical protein
MKLQEIKKFVRDFNMPKELVLNQCSKITDLEKFFESHLSVIDCVSNSKAIKMLHYERVLQAIKLLTKNKGVEKTMQTIPKNKVMSKTPPPEKQNYVKNKNNDIDFKVIEGIENNNVIKPNKDFETKKEINQIKKVKSNNTDSKKEDGDSQMSLF